LATIGGDDVSTDKKVQKVFLLADAFSGIKVISIVTESESDAFTLFETLNSRGLDLNAAELIKNKLLQHSGRESIISISSKWKKVERLCQKETVDFLRTWYNSEKKFVRKPDLYDEYAKLIGRPGRSSLPDISDFCDELVTSAEIYGAILDPSPTTIYRGMVKIGHQTEIINHLRFIRELGFIAMRPLVLAAIRHRSELALRVIARAELARRTAEEQGSLTVTTYSFESVHGSFSIISHRTQLVQEGYDETIFYGPYAIRDGTYPGLPTKKVLEVL